eukprot:TRINITY_DN13936_c0_g1_i1.p1 TRINITY_DN13936_c0_g1~~TRINITY_DN13936_c0_g1_i1.p1  ORF type:complete len:217 (-),score=44.08 TRINITY_DN13936_c0_g1_i1:18-668(-)
MLSKYQTEHASCISKQKNHIETIAQFKDLSTQKTSHELLKLQECERNLEQEWELRKMLRGAYSLQKVKAKTAQEMVKRSEATRKAHFEEHKQVSDVHVEHEAELKELKDNEQILKDAILESDKIVAELEDTLNKVIRTKEGIENELDSEKTKLNIHMNENHGQDMTESIIHAIGTAELDAEEQDFVTRIQSAYESQIRRIRQENNELREELKLLKQ